MLRGQPLLRGGLLAGARPQTHTRGSHEDFDLTPCVFPQSAVLGEIQEHMQISLGFALMFESRRSGKEEQFGNVQTQRKVDRFSFCKYNRRRSWPRLFQAAPRVWLGDSGCDHERSRRRRVTVASDQA